MRENLEHLLNKYSVDLAIWSHCHSYERSYPIYSMNYTNSYINPPATVHLVSGTAGSFERLYKFKQKQPEWSVVRDKQYGYTILNIVNTTHLTVQQKNTFGPMVSFWRKFLHYEHNFHWILAFQNGKIIDAFTIVQENRKFNMKNEVWNKFFDNFENNQKYPWMNWILSTFIFSLPFMLFCEMIQQMSSNTGGIVAHATFEDALKVIQVNVLIQIGMAIHAWLSANIRATLVAFPSVHMGMNVFDVLAKFPSKWQNF